MLLFRYQNMFKFYFDIVFMKTVYLIFERFFNLDDDVIFFNI